MADTPQVPPAQPVRRAGRPAAFVRRLVEEACNEGDLSILDELVPGSASVGAAAQPGAGRLRQVLPEFRAAVPDARWEILEQIATGNTVVTRLQVEGTHRSGLWGIAPTGRMATVTGVLSCRFARGRVVACWAQADLLGLLCQLGVLPAMELERVVAVARLLQTGQAWAGRTGQSERRG
jgi:predicted ester cyclase